jgi:hypothetical protein
MGARPLRDHGAPKKWLKSPAGWALANVWYDRYLGVPPRGSPLETLFLFVYLQRKETELLETRTIVRGQWALLTKDPAAAKASFEAYQAYSEAMFPFLEQAANTTVTDQARLLEHVRYPIEINVASIRQAKQAQARTKSLRKFQAKERPAS